MCRYKGDLQFALKNDCIRWNIELAKDDKEFNRKKELLQSKGLSLYEQFCLPTKAELIPNEFVTMLSIITNQPIASANDRKELLTTAVKERIRKYTTLAISDKTRSRYV